MGNFRTGFASKVQVKVGGCKVRWSWWSFVGFLLKLPFPVFRSTKEDTAGLGEAPSPQDPAIQENLAESCDSSVTPPSSKPSIVSRSFHTWIQVGCLINVVILAAADCSGCTGQHHAADVCSQPELPCREQSGGGVCLTPAALTAWLFGECSVLQTLGILELWVEHVSKKSLL